MTKGNELICLVFSEDLLTGGKLYCLPGPVKTHTYRELLRVRLQGSLIVVVIDLSVTSLLSEL